MDIIPAFEAVVGGSNPSGSTNKAKDYFCLCSRVRLGGAREGFEALIQHIF